MIGTMRPLGIVVVMLAASGIARADEPCHICDPGVALDTTWPAPPPGVDLQIIDHMSELGNRAARRIDSASHDTIGLHIDGRGQRAQLRLRAGTSRYLSLRMDEDIVVGDGKARIASRVDLGVAGHNLHVELPDVEMLPDAYEGNQYVEVRVPVYERRW
jgi:hypothetical protein